MSSGVECHTEGRVRAVVPPSCSGTTRVIEGEEGECVALVGHMDRTAGDIHKDVANAKRLAAAWNACLGVDTKSLKAGLVGQKVAMLDVCLTMIADLVKAAERLRDTPENSTDEPSDELVAAIDETDVVIRAAKSMAAGNGIKDAMPMQFGCVEPAATSLAALNMWCDGETVCPPALVGQGRALGEWCTDTLAALVMGREMPSPDSYKEA